MATLEYRRYACEVRKLVCVLSMAAVYTSWYLNGFDNGRCALLWWALSEAANLLSSSTCWEFLVFVAFVCKECI